ncbi:cation transporter [bacterium]|nr:cation transporter [bacterium]
MHQHAHGTEEGGKRLLFVVVLNAVITLSEFIGGFLSGSLALLTDALHNLTDVTAIIISYLAHKRAHKSATPERTFGFRRSEVVAAFFNTVVLMIIALFILKEAISRIYRPSMINTDIMIGVATVGFLGNLFSVLLLKRDVESNINFRAAFLHLLSDTLSSVAVILGGIFINITGIPMIDPILTFAIGAYILYAALKILLDATHILMQGTPKGIDIERIKLEMENLNEIDNVHNMHVWSLNERQIYLECHVDICRDLKLSQLEIVKADIHQLLNDEFSIEHITLQFEYKSCKTRNILDS